MASPGDEMTAPARGLVQFGVEVRGREITDVGHDSLDGDLRDRAVPGERVSKTEAVGEQLEAGLLLTAPPRPPGDRLTCVEHTADLFSRLEPGQRRG